MHQIKPKLRRQDLEGIHLPSFRFSWKLNKLCRVDFFVFESWQTAVKSQGKTITSSAVCHDSKTKKCWFSLHFPFLNHVIVTPQATRVPFLMYPLPTATPKEAAERLSGLL
jgi:hypothetical protein